MDRYADRLAVVAERLGVDVDDAAVIHICHGLPRCAGNPDGCPDCYVIDADDPRTADEIMADMARSH